MDLEAQKINTAYRSLLKATGSSLSSGDKKKIRQALDLAIKACDNNVTITGEPEVIHVLSVAYIIAAEMGLGLTAIITALLHDSYNRLDISQQELEKLFAETLSKPSLLKIILELT